MFATNGIGPFPGFSTVWKTVFHAMENDRLRT